MAGSSSCTTTPRASSGSAKASNGEIIAVGEAYEVESQREEGHRVGAEERGPAPRVDLTE